MNEEDAHVKVLVSVCVGGLLFCLSLAWWASTSGPKAVAARSNERTVGVYFNGMSGNVGDDRMARSVDRRLPETWIPTDAERLDDDGAYLSWVQIDA